MQLLMRTFNKTFRLGQFLIILNGASDFSRLLKADFHLQSIEGF